MRATIRLCLAAAPLALLCAGAPALAQSASDFRLEPAPTTPAPRTQGPVDPDAPVIRPSAAPPPAETPAPAPAPSVAAPAPSAAPVARAPGVPPGPRANAPAAPVVAGTPAPAAQGPAPVESAPALPTPTLPGLPTAAPASAPVTSPAASPAPWPWLAIGGGLLVVLAGIGGALFMRRRRFEAELAEPDFERPRAVVDAPQPGPEATLPAPSTAPLALSLEATRMSATLMNVTLAYRLVVSNGSDSAIGPIYIAADMIAAHASLAIEEQLGTDGAPLELRHELPGLAPGESAVLSGELRLPLARINPIRSGELALFIPLARFRAESGDLHASATFVVGESAADAAPLRPFRLDLGPRVYSQLGQREIGQQAA